MSASVTERLEAAERMLRRLEIELAEIRRLSSSPQPEPEHVVEIPATEPEPVVEIPATPRPVPEPAPAPVFRELEPMRMPQFRLPQVSQQALQDQC